VQVQDVVEAARSEMKQFSALSVSAALDVLPEGPTERWLDTQLSD
jgi:hypothetical protein